MENRLHQDGCVGESGLLPPAKCHLLLIEVGVADFVLVGWEAAPEGAAGEAAGAMAG